MSFKKLGGVRLIAAAAAVLLVVGVTDATQVQADESANLGSIELVAQSAASNALAAHCSGSTRGVFRTTRGWLDFMVTNARQLTGRTFEQDLVTCAENLPKLGNEGFAAIGALAGVCDELRASPATCKFIRRQQNLYITVRG